MRNKVAGLVSNCMYALIADYKRVETQEGAMTPYVLSAPNLARSVFTNSVADSMAVEP